MQIPGPDGRVYNVPDDTTTEQLNDYFRVKSKEDQISPYLTNAFNKPENKKLAEQIMQETGGNRTPIDTMKDWATGLGKAGQNIGNLIYDKFKEGTLSPMAKAMQDSGHEVPSFIQKQLNHQLPQINMEQQFGTQGGNPLAQIGAQYFAPGFSGGVSLPGQVLSNTLFGYSQGTPGEKNLGGFLPEGRIGSAIEGGLMGALPFGIAKGFGAIKKGIDYFRPGKTSEKFIAELGQDKTAGENIEELGKRVSLARQSAEAEALAPKEQLMATEAKQRVFPSQKRGKELVNDVSEIFGENESEIALADKTALTKALKEYYKTGDMEQLVAKSEDIFKHPGLTDNQLSNLSKALEMEPLKKGKYLSRENVDKNYKGLGLDEVHSRFKNNPTVENGDELLSDIGKEIRKLESISERSGGLTGSPRVKLDRLYANRKALSKDLEDYFHTLPPEKQALYSEFRQKWRENIPKYKKSGTTIRKLSEGESKGLSREEISSAFKNPDEQVEQILSEIGTGGKQNILYNELLNIDPRDAKSIANSILNFKRAGGGESYVSPEHEMLANELIKRLRHKKIAGIGLGGGGAALAAEEYIRNKYF